MLPNHAGWLVAACDFGRVTLREIHLPTGSRTYALRTPGGGLEYFAESVSAFRAFERHERAAAVRR